MKKILIILGLFSMVALSASSQEEFTEYLNRKEACESWKELDPKISAEIPVQEVSLPEANPGTKESVQIHKLSLTPLEWPKKGGILKKTWEQEIVLFKPYVLKSKTALIIVSSGSSHSWNEELLKQLAIDTGSLVAILSPVPNQPLTTADGKDLKEDELMAFTWNQFLEKRRASALLLAPMCKSIKSALDAIEEWGKTANVPIEGFALAGKSKRAWASWLLAANDPRVDLLIACSFNFLNFNETALYQHKTLGDWPEALISYIRAGFNEKSIQNRVVNKLFSIVDPYAWKSKLKQHKYIVASASDPFFIADSTQFYFKNLEGVNELRFYPSAAHNLNDELLIKEMAPFLIRYMQKSTFPKIASELNDKRLKVTFDEKPKEAILWYSFAKNMQAMHKDTSPKWQSIPLPPIFQDTIEVQIPHHGSTEKEESVTAAFVELRFKDGFVATTEVAVVR